MELSDEQAFTRMFEDHYEAVLRYAWRRAGPAYASDIAAETFKIAWEKFDRIPHDRPLPWLYTTARNLTLNLIRGDRRRTELIESLGADLAHDGAEGDHAATVAARHAALAALSRLSETDRELVLLICWEGLDLRQAAAVTGCSRATAAMRLHRARKRLGRLLVNEQRPADHAYWESLA
ncbi:RNA polymerase sigma factor [Actinoallomurus acanthiterrae]